MTETAQNDGFGFLQLSKGIAKNFLHTVVFVDEQAYFEEPERPRKLTTPGRGVKSETTKAEAGTLPEQNHNLNAKNHNLNAKEVMDAFASEGVVCTVLKPAEGEDPLGKAINAAKRADAVILDWDIHGDDGKTALKVIKKIHKDDQEHSPRLRLILIYSGEPDIIGLSEKVKKTLGSGYKNVDDFTFTCGHLRIGIFSKEHTKVVAPYESRVVTIKDLPDRLAEELAHITAGILSNVALKSMSVLRDNTHMILGTFGRELDPAYLSHRSLLPNPDDAMDHAVDLVASEFRSVLETHEIGKTAGMDFISKYLKKRIGDSSEVEMKLGGSLSAKLRCSDLIDIQENGLVNSTWLENYVKEKHRGIEPEKIQGKKIEYEKKAYRTLTEVFTIDGEDPKTSDNKLAAISSFKRRNGSLSKNPVLTQGTILREEKKIEGDETSSGETGNYCLCIQPRCDCVRIESKRNFLFLPLRVVDENNKFDFVIEFDSDNFMRLKIVNTTYELISFEFPRNGSKEGLVQATAEGNRYYFNSNGKKFRWIAELKNDKAQRIVNNFAAHLSRVGTDDYEWLRRSAT